MKKYIYAFIILIFLVSCSSQKCDEIEINMDGKFIAYEIKIPIKEGVTTFEITENSVFHIETFVNDAYNDYFHPWSKAMFITVTTPDGIEKKLSGKICRTDYISYAGNIIIRIKYNPKYFNPLAGDIVQSGFGINSKEFKQCPIILKIRNVKNCKKNIPFLEDLPTEKKKKAKTDGNSSLSIPFVFKPGLEVLREAMSPDDNISKHQVFGGPLPAEKQEKIKKDFEDAVKLLKSTFEIEGEKENE